MINTRDHRGVAKEIHLDVLNVEGSGFETRIFDVGKKFLLVAEFAVPFGIHKPAGNQGLESRRIAVDLSLIPQVLQNQQLALAWIGLLGGQCDRTQEPAEDSSTELRIISYTLAGIPTWGERARTIAVGIAALPSKMHESAVTNVTEFRPRILGIQAEWSCV